MIIDVIGARPFKDHTRFYGLDENYQGDRHVVYFQKNWGVENYEMTRAHLSRSLCSPESYTWTRDEAAPQNPSLLYIWEEIRQHSVASFNWPVKTHERTNEAESSLWHMHNADQIGVTEPLHPD